MALISVPVAFGTVALAGKIIHLIYPPPEFAPAALILAILVGSVAFGHLNAVIGTLLLATNRQKASMVASLIIAAAATVANIIFVPVHGPIAVACIVAGTDLVFFVGMYVYLRRTDFSFSIFALYVKPVVAAACMVAALLLVPEFPVLLLVVLGMVAYAIVIFLVRGLGQQERELIQGMLRRLD